MRRPFDSETNRNQRRLGRVKPPENGHLVRLFVAVVFFFQNLTEIFLSAKLNFFHDDNRVSITYGGRGVNLIRVGGVGDEGMLFERHDVLEIRSFFVSNRRPELLSCFRSCHRVSVVFLRCVAGRLVVSRHKNYT